MPLSAIPMVELPLTQGSYLAIGLVGVLVAGLVCLGATYRLIQFMTLYEWSIREVWSTPFGRKRLAIHLLVLAGTLFALVLYGLLLAQGHRPHQEEGEEGHQLCIGLLALQRFQFICVFAALGLILSDWRIDVYEAPSLTRRVALYRLRDLVTGVLLAASFLLNCAGPLLCLDSAWASSSSQYGPSADGKDSSQAIVLNTAYILQVLCALLLMTSMLYSGLQMKTRLLWASRSPIRQNDLFRVALRQLDIILIVCTLSFISQVLALSFNYVQLVVYDEMLVWSPLIWCFAVWLPSLGWSLSCLYLARKARRQSFANAAPPARNSSSHHHHKHLYVHNEDFVQVLLGSEGDDVEGEEEEGQSSPYEEEEEEQQSPPEQQGLLLLPETGRRTPGRVAHDLATKEDSDEVNSGSLTEPLLMQPSSDTRVSSPKA